MSIKVTNVETINMRNIDGSNTFRYFAVVDDLAFQYQTRGNPFNLYDNSGHLSREEWIDFVKKQYIKAIKERE